MSNNAPARVRNSVAASTPADPRVARTTHALGRALIELIQERDYDQITVQHILDRAGVGRATFYAHYRNKDDALHSSYEALFGVMERLLDRQASAAPRLFPVAEFISHLADAGRLADALRRSGLLDDLWELFVGHAAAIIDRRLASWPAGRSTVPRPLAARMLAGALLEMVRWGREHPSRMTAGEMDLVFHDLARGLLRGT